MSALLLSCLVAAALSVTPAADLVEVHPSGYAFFYIVPVDGGVLLFDAGLDPTGDDVVAAVGGRRVLAVFITHAHIDHFAGAFRFGDVPVYVGAADVAVINGTRLLRAPLQRLAGTYLQPHRPTHVVDVVDGAVIHVGNGDVRAVAVPGHTPGSTVWLWRDVAFTGDAVGGDGDDLDVAPGIVSDDPQAARWSVSRLWGLPATTLFDGHSGRVDDAKAKLQRLIARHGAPR